MRILLVQPKASDKVVYKDKFSMHEPLALEYIGAGVRDGHEVRILDMRLEDDLDGNIAEFRPDIVAATGFTIHVNEVKRVLAAAKKSNPSILTVVGGHHATVRPEDFAQGSADVVVIGEGVVAFRELVERRERKESFDGVQGIAVVKDGRILKSPYRPYTDLDLLPLPDRSLTARYRQHYFIPSMRPLASIRTSLGCYFRCTYCALWQITQGRYLARDPESVVNELSTIREGNIFFADDESMLKVERMSGLADRIAAAGIKKRYRLFARSDTVVKNPKLFEKWRDIGMDSVVIGFEAFMDDDLKKLNKATTTSVNEQAISILKHNGIKVCADFIVTQDYDRQKFRRLSDYVKRLGLQTVIFPILTPLPGTKLNEEKQDQIFVNDYDLYDFKHTILPTALPLDVFYSEYAKLHLLMFPGYRALAYRWLFPLTKHVPTFTAGYEILRSLKNLYRDHRSAPEARFGDGAKPSGEAPAQIKAWKAVGRIASGIKPINRIPGLSRLRTRMAERLVNMRKDYPFEYVLEITTRCNHHCKMCTFKNKPNTNRGDMSFDTYKKIIDEIPTGVEKLIEFAGGGEPLLHKDFLKFLEYGKSKHPRSRFFLSTNGSYLDASMGRELIDMGLDLLNIGLNSATREGHAWLTNANDFDSIVENSVDFLKTKNANGFRKPFTFVQIIECKELAHEIEAFKAFWQPKADKLQIRHVIAGMDDGVLKKQDIHQIHQLPSRRFACILPFRCLSIAANGDLFPCNVFSHEGIPWGNIGKSTINAMWTSKEILELRRLLLEDRYFEQPVCRDCDMWGYSNNVWFRNRLGIGKRKWL